MFDAIILAGGSARRLDGKDKAAIEIGGVPLLDRAIAAAKGAVRVVVVGPQRATAAEVTWTREDPPGGGPVAAIAAALGLVEEAYCLVLAADLPWVAGAVPLLLMAASKTDVAVLTATGRRNNLAAVWRTAALREAVDRLDETRDAAVHELLASVRVIDVVDEDDWGADCDTWPDVEAAKKKQGNA
ncbi:MAG TPA: molybdenum cofactor guanylyltransferase [Jatrophihabitantaceae bacterium]|jgi:molybdopterin-guanine dinucleotide biosynthesis protein A|nr:molybdenum cofactor guanylyltransferase [Jatrophihabitantaceae bacterium]